MFPVIAGQKARSVTCVILSAVIAANLFLVIAGLDPAIHDATHPRHNFGGFLLTLIMDVPELGLVRVPHF
jgi:hypothetical protein